MGWDPCYLSHVVLSVLLSTAQSLGKKSGILLHIDKGETAVFKFNIF